jgi:triphosphatase
VRSQKELELKLALPPESLPALRRIPLLRPVKAKSKRTVEVSVYFDTDKRTLRKRGLILRVRRIGERYVQTIKAAGNSGSFDRDEWEAEVAGEQPDLSLAKGSAIEPLLNGKLGRQLKPLFETRVRRAVYPVVNDTCAIALTIDQGTIDTGKRSLPICEVELELHRGSVSDLFDVALELIRFVPARLALKSKSERGYELIDGELDVPANATRISLAEDASTRDAFKRIGGACLEQVIGNESAVIKGDPEGVHQMRVGLRRLRAGMSLFAELLHDPQTAAIKAELKWLADELSLAREFEVLMKRVSEPIERQQAHCHAVRTLLRELAKKRKAAVERAQDAIQSPRFRALTLDIATWLFAGDWATPRDDLVRDRGDLPIRVFAAEQLTRRWRKLRKRRKAPTQLDARDRHKLRIQAKKLRYAVEFFGSRFASKRAVKGRKRLASALEHLQDGLGDLNDIAVNEQRIASLRSRDQSNLDRAFAAGLLTGREDAKIDAAMRTAMEAYAELAKAKPFWG